MPSVAFLTEAAGAPDPGRDGQFLTAHMIWSAESVPVPLKPNGPAAGIASSSDGSRPISTPDLHTVFAREFFLESLPTQAAVRLFAYTRYRLYINGVYCGRGPSRYQNQRPEYDARDVATVVKAGRNLIAVLVHRDAPTGRIMRHEPGFAAVLQFNYGPNRQTIATDQSWRSKPELSFGSRDEAWASIEEHIDARKALDLTDPYLAIENWPTSIAVSGPEFFPVWPRTTPLQAETRREWNAEDKRIPIVLTSSQQITLGLPEIVQGYHNLDFDAEEGSQLEVEYLLPQGAKSGKSSYIARAGAQHYSGGDTFAFDRLSIRLISGRIKLTGAEVVEVRYPFERAASFDSSDPFLNKLWHICARSLEVLSEDSYVDCADRERVEWTDDSPPAFDCTRVMMRGPNQDGAEFWGDSRLLKALLRRIALTQQPDGQLKAHSCSERFDIHAIMEDRSCDWVVLLRQYVESSDDLELVRELWPTLERLLQWNLDRRTNRGLVLAREWEVWDNPLRYQVCEGAGLNAMVYRALRDATWLGGAIGAATASQSYETAADRLKVDFNDLLWNKAAGSYYGGLFGKGSKTNERLDGKMFTGPFENGRYQPTVQAALFALYCDIVPAERMAAVRSFVLSHLNDIETPMSHYYLFHALYGMEDPGQDRKALETMRTGWKNQVESPWQTTWEELKEDGGSKVHMYGMAPGSFLTAYVLGARRMGPVSARTILIEPRCGDLSWTSGTAVTEFGPVDLRWSKDANGALSLECLIPENTGSTLRLYTVKGQDGVMVDGQRVTGMPSGSFIEVQLTTGKHTIAYPA